MTVYSQISNNKNKTYLIMTVFIVIFTGFFYVIGKFTGESGVGLSIVGFTIATISSFFSYFYSDKMVLATTGARPATKEEFFDLYTIIENLSLAEGVPMPRVYVLDDPSPNAFATGRNPKNAVVCATTGLLNILDRSELEGVMAHELSHIKNYDILVSTVTAVLVGTIALISDWIMRSLWWGGIGGGDNDNKNRSPITLILLVVALVITPIVASLIQLAVSRRREYLADASGALLTRYPEGLARALEKIKSYPSGIRNASNSTAHLFISNPFKKGKGGSLFLNLFSTHPPLEKRIEILRKM